MKACPDTDAIVTIGDALHWDIVAGVRHLQTCDHCRASIDALQAMRFALSQVEPVADATLARISAALREEARDERARARTMPRWTSAVEVLLAAMAAPMVLISGGIEISSVVTGLLICALGPALVIGGRRLGLQHAV